MATKQKSGLYRAKVKIGNDKDGKPMYKYISGKTKRELEAARREVIEHHIEGVGVVHDVLFHVYMQKWYDTYKKGRLSPGTKKSYANIMNNYLIPEFGDRNMRSITPSDIQYFVNTLEGRSTGIINLNLTVLRGVFSAAVRDRIIEKNTAAYIVRPEASATKEKYVLSKKEREDIERICAEEEKGIMVAILYYTGMRMGEMLGLQWGDIDLQKNTIHIQRNSNHITHTIGPLKTKQSNRFVPIPEPLAAIIRKHPFGMPTMQMFPGKSYKTFTPTGFYYIFDNMMEKIGLKGKFSAHTLRHNYLTMCYESGIDPYTASRLAGHSNIQITMNTYTHLSKEKMSDINAKVDSMFSNKGCTKVAQKK